GKSEFGGVIVALVHTVDVQRIPRHADARLVAHGRREHARIRQARQIGRRAGDRAKAGHVRTALERVFTAIVASGKPERELILIGNAFVDLGYVTVPIVGEVGVRVVVVDLSRQVGFGEKGLDLERDRIDAGERNFVAGETGGAAGRGTGAGEQRIFNQ